MNKAEELVWTFLQSRVISLTGVFLWKTQRSAPTDAVRPPWKAPPAHGAPVKTYWKQALEREKPAVRHLVSPQLYTPEKAPWFQHFAAPFREGQFLQGPVISANRMSQKSLRLLDHRVQPRSLFWALSPQWGVALLREWEKGLCGPFLTPSPNRFKSELSEPLWNGFGCQLDQ